MPAMIMVHDIILRNIIISILHQNINENKFWGKKGHDTTFARILLNYKAIKNKFNKIHLIDLRKAFYYIGRTILKNIINNNSKIDEIDKSLLNNILIIYDSININILDDTLETTRGLPQGSVYEPKLFKYYINDILSNIKYTK